MRAAPPPTDPTQAGGRLLIWPRCHETQLGRASGLARTRRSRKYTAAGSTRWGSDHLRIRVSMHDAPPAFVAPEDLCHAKFLDRRTPVRRVLEPDRLPQ